MLAHSNIEICKSCHAALDLNLEAQASQIKARSMQVPHTPDLRGDAAAAAAEVMASGGAPAVTSSSTSIAAALSLGSPVICFEPGNKLVCCQCIIGLSTARTLTASSVAGTVMKQMLRLRNPHCMPTKLKAAQASFHCVRRHDLLGSWMKCLLVLG